jgi:HEAT repeat protein
MHTSTYARRVELWSVFVPQSVRESVPVRELPREILGRLRKEGQLSTEPGEADIERYREMFASSPVTPVLEVLRRDRLVIALGDPGSGKTSLLKFLSLRWVAEETGPVPVWIDLKDYARQGVGFLEYVESGGAAFRLDSVELDKRLKGGEATLYLDGLDEIFDGPARGSVVEEIAAFASRYSQAKVVVTSRIVGYEPDRLRNAGFTHATIEDFDDSQVREFIGKWNEAAEQDLKERVRLRQQLEGALCNSQAIRRLSGNPLLLTMMAILNRAQALPRDRVELYAQASRVLLEEWDASRSLPVDTFARQEKEALLRELAGVMQHGAGGLAGNLAERGRLIEVFRDFLVKLGVENAYDRSTSLVKQLTERNFILSYAGADRFSFVHRTFLEYFCAAWFVERFEKKQTLSLEELKEDVFGRHWRDETWHEVLRLIVGMLDEKKGGELIRYLIDQDGRDDKLANLMLAAGCLSEVRNRRAIAATDEQLRRLFTEHVIRYDPPYYYEPADEYKEVMPTRAAAVGLIASVWRSAEIRDWLRSAAEDDPDWVVRVAAVDELARGWRDDAGTLPWLKERARSDEDRDVRSAAIRVLAQWWPNDVASADLLLEAAQLDEDEFVRAEAVRSLAEGWKMQAAVLPQIKECARSDQSHRVRAAALKALAEHWRADSETLPTVLDAAHGSVRFAEQASAIQLLARMWMDEAEIHRLLLEIIRTGNYYARVAALRELARGWKREPETIRILTECARSAREERVREAALEEIARGWRDAASLSFLKERARADGSYSVRQNAVHEVATGWKDDSETLPWLKEIARSGNDWASQSAAVKELANGWNDDSAVLEIVTALAHTNDFRVRREVMKSARAWKDKAALLSMLKHACAADSHGNVRWAALEELARGWKDSSTATILKERSRIDPDKDVRMSAMQELARGWEDEGDTPAILKEKARNDENDMVRGAAAEELARAWRSDPDTQPLVKGLVLSDGSEWTRTRALMLLTQYWKRDADTIATVKERARLDSSEAVRQTAVEKLGWGADPEALVILKERARDDQSAEVRGAALRALTRRWRDDPEVIVLLESAGA